MKVNFNSQDIIENRHYADLLEDGDFYADYIVVEETENLNDPIEKFYAIGDWWQYDKNTEELVCRKGILTVYNPEYHNCLTYKDVFEGNISGGKIFNCGWQEWTIEPTK